MASTYTLISAIVGDRDVPGVDIASPDSPIDYRDLPAAAQAWAAAQGFGVDDPDELIYVVPGAVELDGWPTYVVSPGWGEADPADLLAEAGWPAVLQLVKTARPEDRDADHAVRVLAQARARTMLKAVRAALPDQAVAGLRADHGDEWAFWLLDRAHTLAANSRDRETLVLAIGAWASSSGARHLLDLVDGGEDPAVRAAVCRQLDGMIRRAFEFPA